MIPKINKLRAEKLINKGALLLDVRDPVKFRDGHITDAINVSVRGVSSMLKYPKTTKMIIYGMTDQDSDINTVGNYLFQLGFPDVYTIGSIDNWNKG
jgi:rhodanese-related sulfurtransferase